MTQDVQAVLRSQEYYRLKQAVQSPGDIYELNESAKAIYIGPDSDISEVQVTYFNPDEPLALETATIAVNGPFVGRVDSLPQTTVPSTGQPARILVSPVDIVDNAYASPTSIAFRRFNIPTVIDLIVALKNLPDIPSVRADRTFRFASVPYQDGPVTIDDNGGTDLLIPIYGRRMVTIVATGNNFQMEVGLVNLQPGISPAPRFLGVTVQPATLPVVDLAHAVILRASDASRNGFTFDAAAVPTGSYYESDAGGQAAPGVFANAQPRGMADLLYIQLRTDTVFGGLITRFADLFIKITDQET
jgi:hypothetical protein